MGCPRRDGSPTKWLKTTITPCVIHCRQIVLLSRLLNRFWSTPGSTSGKPIKASLVERHFHGCTACAASLQHGSVPSYRQCHVPSFAAKDSPSQTSTQDHMLGRLAGGNPATGRREAVEYRGVSDYGGQRCARSGPHLQACRPLAASSCRTTPVRASVASESLSGGTCAGPHRTTTRITYRSVPGRAAGWYTA